VCASYYQRISHIKNKFGLKISGKISACNVIYLETHRYIRHW